VVPRDQRRWLSDPDRHSREDGKGLTRNGYDWTKKYQRTIEAARQLGRDCHLEGEMIVQDERGRPDFNALRSDIESGAGGRLILYCFDLLSLDGEDLRSKPCEERRARLGELIAEPAATYPVHFSQQHGGPGAEFFAAVEKMNLEGSSPKNGPAPTAADIRRLG
jgi:bifunctional non-homologous end joining protein LigD